ncbi:hypothetical protein BB559_005443 [Furculomyces boomerangus]|uniref:Carbonic anhydrase n=2 Tax=Harpellales TaxID=61421 RepID=A0A2T9Y8R1_9FUNG|nr:hypothetical protein BB559_005443 [Furculomyces boomerangus]PWA01108.1 hypothetical protein BB558_002830 [Smittium angustum]
MDSSITDLLERNRNRIKHKSNSFLESCLQRNKMWADMMYSENPNYFDKKILGQSPGMVWFGCSDSRVAADVITDSPPGNLFTHRNIANSIMENDTSSLSVLQYSIGTLKVSDVVVVGHTYCGGIDAAMNTTKLDGPILEWLQPISELYQRFKPQIDSLKSPEEKNLALGRLNVKRVVHFINCLDIVKKARKSGQTVNIHGWMYHTETGILKDLGITKS